MIHTLIILLLFLSTLSANAEVLEMTVTVKDINGRPVENVIAFLKAEELSKRLMGEKESPAVISQENLHFEPHILVLPKGASVIFPNNDVVAHHVYSFSKPNNFILDLYKSDHTPAPVIFEHPGVVTLGCNIHDSMLGYILVIDSNVYGKTNAQGNVNLEYDSNWTNPTISIWHPRIRDKEKTLSMPIEKSESVIFNLNKKLLAKRDQSNNTFNELEDDIYH